MQVLYNILSLISTEYLWKGMQSASNVGENDNILDWICDKYYVEIFYFSIVLHATSLPAFYF